jgi:Icc protein
MAATLLHLTDTHLPENPGEPVCDRDADAQLDKVLAACRQATASYDAIVLTGDQTDDASVAAHRRLRRMLDPAGAEIVAVPGNHDLADAHGEGWPEPTWCELGRWRVLGVDTSIPGEIHGRIDIDALCSELDARDDRFTVLAMHHPPKSPATHDWFRLLGGQALLHAIAHRPHVRALISGHVHLPFAWKYGQCALLGGPSTLTPFAHEGREDHQVVVGKGAPTGARVLRLLDDGRCEHRLVLMGVPSPSRSPE